MHALALSAPFSGLLLSFLGLGLPVGTPPEKEDAIMAHVAPSDCVAYTSWSARAQPNATSGNQTEQLLAEPEVQKLIASLHEKALAAALAGAKQNGVPAEQAD